MTTETRLAHLTLGSGYRTTVARRDVDDAAVADAHLVLDAVLARGAAQLLPPRGGFALGIDRFGGAALFTLLGVAPDEQSVEAIATFGVAPRARQGVKMWDVLVAHAGPLPGPPPVPPPAPWCVGVNLPELSQPGHIRAVEWMRGFQQAIAWAWLGREK